MGETKIEWTGRTLGVHKGTAKRLGLDFAGYVGLIQSGQKWCVGCKAWQPRATFGVDRTRGDGLATACLESRHTGRPRGWHGQPRVNPLTGRPGPVPAPSRDGDKLQARHRVNVEVRLGRRANPNALPCSGCGHIGADRRHEYHHHLGYAAEHHFDVEPLCTVCHAARHNIKTHCLRGHVLDDANTAINANGTRACRACRRERERKRAPRSSEYWRKVNRRRANG